MRFFLRAAVLSCWLVPAPLLAAPKNSPEELIARGEYPAAIEAYREQARAERDPKARAKLLFTLLEICYLASRASAFKEDQREYLKIARDAGEELLLSDGKNARLWLMYGQVTQDLGALTVAEDAFGRALAYGEIAAASKLGFLAAQNNDHELAVSAFTAALNENPADTGLWLQLSESYFLLERFDDARTSAERADALSPNDVRTLRLIAAVYVRLGRTEEAASTYERLVALYPLDFRYTSQLALFYARLERGREAQYHYEASVKTLRGLLDQKPGYEEALASVLNNYAWLLCTSKTRALQHAMSYERAYEMASESVELSGEKNPTYLDTLAEAAFLTGRLSEARTRASQALALNPSHPYYRDQLARFQAAGWSPSTRGARLLNAPRP